MLQPCELGAHMLSAVDKEIAVTLQSRFFVLVNLNKTEGRDGAIQSGTAGDLALGDDCGQDWSMYA